MHALRHCLCSYVLNFDNDEEATDEKMRDNFWYVKITKINGWRKRRGFVPRPKTCPERERGRDWPFSHVANNY